MLKNQRVPYTLDGEEFFGYMAWDDAKTELRPAVLVGHAWRGLDDFTREKTDELARLGYIGFAADVFGHGKTAQTNQEAFALITPLFQDRQLLRRRVNAGLNTLAKQPVVNIQKMGAIGFCFGGLTVIELLRSGAAIKGAVSFHGVLGTKMGDLKATLAPNAKEIIGALLLLHGHDDPLVSQQDITSLEKELTDANVDWQLNIYSQTAHAFMNKGAHDIELGLIYQPRTASRAWKEMRRFFEEIFI